MPRGVYIRTKETRESLSKASKKRWKKKHFTREYKDRSLLEPKYKATNIKTEKDKARYEKISKAVKKAWKEGKYKNRFTEENIRQQVEKRTGQKRSKRTKELMSFKAKNRVKQPMHDPEVVARKVAKTSGPLHPFYGKKFSLEYRKKLSDAHKGIPLSAKHKKAIGKGSKEMHAKKKNKSIMSNIKENSMNNIKTLDLRITTDSKT